jgi:type I restriction enzyme M protein
LKEYVEVVTLDIRRSNYNLNIPLYVEKVIEDNLPSVEEALRLVKRGYGRNRSRRKFKTIYKKFI